MKLPVWVYLGSDVLYVYRDGDKIMMEVYIMDGGWSSYQGTKPCDYDLSKLRKLESPWKDIMESRWRKHF